MSVAVLIEDGTLLRIVSKHEPPAKLSETIGRRVVPAGSIKFKRWDGTATRDVYSAHIGKGVMSVDWMEHAACGSAARALSQRNAITRKAKYVWGFKVDELPTEDECGLSAYHWPESGMTFENCPHSHMVTMSPWPAEGTDAEAMLKAAIRAELQKICILLIE